MKNVQITTMTKALLLMFVLSGAIFAGEKVLVVADGAYVSAMRSSGMAVNQYITDLQAAGDTVYYTQYNEVPTNYYPVSKAYHLYSVIDSCYNANKFNGAVLIGELPYASVYYNPDIFPDDYYYMDLYDSNHIYDHSVTWSSSTRVDAFIFTPSECDNHAEIWVSRITSINIYTTDSVSPNGAISQSALLDQYLNRVHVRMTQPEPQPKRFVVVGMYDQSTTIQNAGFQNFNSNGISGWVLWDHGFNAKTSMSDLPPNWQAQLQRGPYGTTNGMSKHLATGFKIKPYDSRTYSGIASDTFSFEWAAVVEHSQPTMNCFEANEYYGYDGVFGSTNAAVAYWEPDTSGTYHDRSLTGMYADSQLPKTRFIMDGGCNNLEISWSDCQGELYSLLGNGLICFGSTTEHSDGNSDFEVFMHYLLNTPGANFGKAFLALANSKPFPTTPDGSFSDWDCYMLLGAGTLTPTAPQGYVKKNIFASYTINDTATDDATNNCWGKIKFTSNSVTGGTYNAASTVYNFYDSLRVEQLKSQGSIVAYSQTYGDSGITIGGHKFYGPIMIEAAQSGFISGYMQTTAKQLIATIPTIWGGATSIKNVKTTATNWWIDSIYGQLQYSASSTSPTFDPTKATYKWYDKNKVYKISTPFCTTYSYVGSRDTLGITTPPIKFRGNYYVKATMPGYRWNMVEENTDSTENWGSIPGFSDNLIRHFGVSGISRRIVNSKSTVTSFVPTINSSNGCLAIAGTAKDSVGIGGVLEIDSLSGSRLGQITAKDTLFSGSSSQRAGVYFGSYPGYHYGSIPFYCFLYQQPDGTIHVRYTDLSSGGTTHDTVLVKTGYTVGKTWLQINQSSSTQVICYASSNNSTYTQVFQYTYSGLYYNGPFEAGVMYASGTSSGSVKFVNITVKKH